MRHRILLAGGGTGGHLYPALNLASALRRRAGEEPRLLYVGARRGLEATVLPERNLPYRLLPMQPIRRSRPWRNWRLLATAPAVWRGLRAAFRDLEPHLVVGTGGYASGPPLLYGTISGCGTALQEQNAAPGLVSRWMAPRVDQVHLGFPEARGRLAVGPDTEVHAFGNPVDVDPERRASPPPWWPAGRVVLVVGGSQGAGGLNRRLLSDLRADAAPPPDADVRLVWVTGPAHEDAVRDGVAGIPWSDRIRVVPFVEGLSTLLHGVELAVSRAGAMFVSELTAAGVPAVLVPFPGAAGGHQEENARRLADAGAAEVRLEGRLDRGELWSSVREILGDRDRRREMAEAARRRGAPGAADRIAGELLQLAARHAASGPRPGSPEARAPGESTGGTAGPPAPGVDDEG